MIINIVLGFILGVIVTCCVLYSLRTIKLRNEYMDSLDDKQARKYMELKRKMNFGFD